MSHNPLSQDFARKLERVHRFGRIVEETLLVEAAALDAQLADESKTLDPDATRELYEFHAEDYIELSDELPTVLRYSILVAADTALEAYLNDTCQTFAEVHKTRLVLSDLTGSG